MSSTVFLSAGLAGILCGVGVFAGWRFIPAIRKRPGLPLVATVLLAFGLLALVAGWLLGEPNPNRGEALKTGGLAAGSIVALYALWLNDRKRQVEEERQEIERSRQELESNRAEHDRERVADERFARSVEMLGDTADQVRVGAMHALAGLAASRPYYTQTVLDVLCSYLRRPFEWSAQLSPEDQRERVVRLTAQRLIANLLPSVTADAPRYDLDLTGATLEYFDISERTVGELTMRFCQLRASNSMWGCEIHGHAWLTGSESHGPIYSHDMTFHRRAWFSGFVAHGPVYLARTRFLGLRKFSGAVFDEGIDGFELADLLDSGPGVAVSP